MLFAPLEANGVGTFPDLPAVGDASRTEVVGAVVGAAAGAVVGAAVAFGVTAGLTGVSVGAGVVAVGISSTPRLSTYATV
jgi:hypothetical protein